MLNDLMQLLGGLGLFLLGMAVMTDGLRGLAGDYFNKVLAGFTNSPLSGAVSGALTTALLQSSSATTVAAVGFVGAGLLTFPQALGVIFGANLGTTITGWLVALLGLKLQIGSLVFPLILVGALVHLFARGRLRHTGLAIAGFALIFLGIANLQAGMAAYQGAVTPGDFPADTAVGRMQLVLIGVAITLITQSSSAGVATALTAVHTGAISFPQAAALVIGMDVGTTVTAAIATLGGSVDTRRTGYSHVVYNLLTAVGALLLLSPYAWLWQSLAPGTLVQHAEIALVGFHSLFNLVGIVVVLPFARHFAAMMVRLVPAPEDPVLDRLDRHLLSNPPVALDSVVRLLAEQARETIALVHSLLLQQAPGGERVRRLRGHIAAIHGFIDRIHLQPEQQRDWARLNACMHLLDHLHRLVARCEAQPQRAQILATEDGLAQRADHAAAAMQQIGVALGQGRGASAVDVAERCADRMRGQATALRDTIMADVAAGSLDVPTGTGRLESVRWLRRVTYHVWRVCFYLESLKAAEKGR